MSFRWSEETTLKFVSKYVQHECLWNIKSPHYKNKQMKQSAYLDLENIMNIAGFGEKEIKLKIKNIRLVHAFINLSISKAYLLQPIVVKSSFTLRDPFLFRSTYSQELKKIKDSKSSGAGTDTIYIPSVKWFSLLDASLRDLTSILTQSESNLVSTYLSIYTHCYNTIISTWKIFLSRYIFFLMKPS